MTDSQDLGDAPLCFLPSSEGRPPVATTNPHPPTDVLLLPQLQQCPTP